VFCFHYGIALSLEFPQLKTFVHSIASHEPFQPDKEEELLLTNKTAMQMPADKHMHTWTHL